MTNINLFNFYIFLDEINNSIKKNILRLKKKNIIINFKLNNENINKFNEIIKFVKKNSINFFIKDNYKLAVKYKANGLFLSSVNKSFNIPILFKRNFKIIGSAHNQFEYYIKLKQKCNLVTFSPIFFNNKYSANKILGVIKFNLLTLNWKCHLCALGGINKEKLNKILSTKTRVIGVKGFIE